MAQPSTGGVFVSFRLVVITCALAATAIPASAQTTPPPTPSPTLIVGRNSNMLGGEQILRLNPFEVRGDILGRADNEPSCTISSRRSDHIICGSNTYRMVDVPGVSATSETRDAWQAVLQSKNGGDTWESTLHPGFFLDPQPHWFKLFDFRAAADATLRSGPAGVAFHSGIAFKKDKSVNSVFVSTFIDLDNRENDPMPFKFVRTTIVDLKSAPKFIDKPWIYVEAAPAGQTCTMIVATDADGTTPLWASTWWGKLVSDWLSKQWPGWQPKQYVTQTVPASIVHLAYSIFQDAGDKTSDLMYSKSTNCGLSFSTPKKINAVTEPNNGLTIAKPPVTGTQRIVSAWRRVHLDATTPGSDAILAVASTNDGNSWGAPKVVAEICPFDQGTSANSFRTTAFPTMTMDAAGRAYLAWAERKRLANGACDPEGASRIMMSTSLNGVNWSLPQAAVPSPTGEHQIFPSVAFTAGKLFLAWVDFTEDVSGVFRKYVDEANLYLQTNPPTLNPPAVNPPARRHTADVRAAIADPIAAPNFGNDVTRVSRYLMGKTPSISPTVPGEPVQLQWNAVNRRWARRSTVPFDGDYIDIATRAYLPPDLKATPPRPNWTPNNGTVPTTPTVLFTWTDNRDMREVKKTELNADGSVPFLVPQTKPGVLDFGLGTKSIVDPTQDRSACVAQGDVFKTGTSNQNIYSARGLVGFAASSPSGNKVLGLVPRSFVVYVRNDSEILKSFRLQIPSQPAGGTASFDQFATQTIVEPLMIPRHSSVARTVFVRKDATATALDPKATIRVDVIELTGTEVGATEAIYLNGDRSAPEIDSPEIDSREIYLPEIDSPEIDSRGVNAPEIDSPEIDSPEIDSVTLKSLGLGSPEIDSGDILAPEIDSPEIDSPEIDSAFLNEAPIQDMMVEMTNTGNTTAHYNAKSLVKGVAPGAFNYQIIVRRRYDLRAVNANCAPTSVPTSKVLVNLLNVNPDAPEIDSPEIDSSAPGTATFPLAPGEKADIIVRIRKINLTAPDLTLANVLVAAQQNAVNTDDAAAGITEPPVLTSSLSIGTSAVPLARTGVLYSYQLFASGGREPFIWSEVGGELSNLPPGITLSPTGVLQGTPTSAGTYTFTVQVHDSPLSGPVQTASRQLSMTVTTAGIASLSFVTQPSDTPVGQIISPAISVRALNAAGAPLVSAPVTISFASSPEGAILSGTLLAITNSSGVAVFSALSINKIGGGYTLRATSPGMPVATSATFRINGILIVTNTADTGPGSFRQAILDANQNSEYKDTIKFAVPTTTISPLSALPTITDPLVISGFIGESSAPGIVLNGANAGAGANGLVLNTGNSMVEGLVIQSFRGHGILIQGTGGNIVRGNYIGTSAGGTTAAPNSGNGVQVIDSPNNVIGGASGAGNLISGNSEGVRIDGAFSTGNVVQGNYIGTNVNLTGGIPNTASGIFIRRSPGNAVIGNTVAHNTGFAGVALCGNVGGFCGGTDIGNQDSNGDGNVVQNNFISENVRGLTLDGVANTLVGTGGSNNISANSRNGIMIFGNGATGNRIVGNAINGNAGDGVQITGDGNTGNLLQGNTFVNNTDLAIDLNGDGVTDNNFVDPLDADPGPNNLQNFPVITTANPIGVTGTLNSAANTTFMVQLYSSGACDASGFGEGQNVVSTFTVTTNSDGYASFVQDVQLNTGDRVTATATDPFSNTSEFSACALVSGYGATDAVGDAGVAENPDLRAVAAEVSGSNLIFEVRFAPGTFNAATTYIDFGLDTDKNASSGYPGIDASCTNDATVLGSDYFIRIGEGMAKVYIANGNTCGGLQFVQTVAMDTVANGVNVTVPRAAIMDEDGRLRFKIVTYRKVSEGAFTGIVDRLTDLDQPAVLVGTPIG